MSTQQNTVIIIAGPTASGKTALAIQLAQHFNTSIISADSRQCFKELNIGVAKPSPEELAQVQHYFIDTCSIHEEITAHTFETYALAGVEEIFQHNAVAIMAGGTGLYIQAFCEGLDDIPLVDPAIRIQINENYQQFGLSWLQGRLQMLDPEFWAVAEQQNPQRLMRALEVKTGTGTSIIDFRKRSKKQRPFNIVKLGLDIPRELLYRNIEYRTDQMILHGLVEEAKALMPFKHLNALQTVGYRELFESFNGRTSIQEAIQKIKINTRHYAKRQLTWFKKDNSINWGNFDTFSADTNAFFAINDK